MLSQLWKSGKITITTIVTIVITTTIIIKCYSTCLQGFIYLGLFVFLSAAFSGEFPEICKNNFFHLRQVDGLKLDLISQGRRGFKGRSNYDTELINSVLIYL